MPYIPDHSSSLYPPCFYCKHLTHMGGQEPSLKGWTCKAFPEKIPYSILARIWDHTEPIIAQAGSYVFEHVPETLEGEEGLWTITFEGEWKPATPTT